MRKCFCPEELGGAGYFAPRTNQWNDWEPTSSISQSQSETEGKATPDNTILAHRLCNKLDYFIPKGFPSRRISRESRQLARRPPRRTCPVHSGAEAVAEVFAPWVVVARSSRIEASAGRLERG